ncbi:MAG: GcrA family cell cycle regulator [Candidatus Acidiferrum sp.]
MIWTQARVETLRSSWAIGLSPAQIAGALGVTRNAVIGKAWRLGLADRRVMRKARKPRPEHRRVAKPRPAPAPCKSVCRPLFDLADDQCRWVVDVGEFLFCGAPIAGSRHPYCARHLQESRRR